MRSTHRVAVSFGLRVVAVAFFFLSVCGVSVATAQSVERVGQALPVRRVMTLDPPTTAEREARSLVGDSRMARKAPENFREFGTLRAGQVVEAKSLTLRFAAAAKLTKIESTPDFKVEQGGSCVEGYSYAANETCTLLVRFTPQGPGRRTGKVTVTNSVDIMPLAFGIGGSGTSPAISFTPSIITTVPSTYVAGAGVLKGALNLAVDKSDTLYVADTGNNAVRYMDSSGVMATLNASALSAPTGIVTDFFGEVFFTEPAANALFEFFDYSAYANQLNGSGTDSCIYTATTPCYLNGEKIYSPTALSIDGSGQLYVTDNYYGAVSFNGSSDTMVRISDPFYDQSSTNGFAVDAYGGLYTGWLRPGQECQIMYQSYSSAYYGTTASSTASTKVAGGRTCGFSGDGGQAGNAQIGTSMGQIAFDVAGNLYFTDTANQRVRRIDQATGLITTVAGNGATGFYGDGGPATAAALNNPTGVGVDSQGQIYVISSSATTGTAQVVRKVGTVGALNLGNAAVGSPTAAQMVTVSNTGNANLDFAHVGFSSGNTTDFAIDPTTTNCVFTVPLAAGRSCKIGFIFTAAATGARAAVFSMSDDTVAGLNTIQLSGTGYTTATVTPASLAFANTNVGSASASQTVTLTNAGKAAMTISSINITGTGAASFAYTTTCGSSLAIGASCTIAVTFNPMAAGALSGVLNLNDNALGAHQVVSLTGTGVAVAKASLSPTSLTFSSTTVGATSVAQTVKLSNTGTAALGITSISMTGTNLGDFPITNNCGTSVAAGGSCNINVSFKPTATGTRTANVSVVASTGTLTAAVTGTAVAAAKSTKVTLSQEQGSLASGQTIMLNARVQGSSPTLPQGNVQVWEGSHMWAERKLAAGGASFKMERLTTGVHFMKAVYLGSGDAGVAQSAPLQVVIGRLGGQACRTVQCAATSGGEAESRR